MPFKIFLKRCYGTLLALVAVTLSTVALFFVILPKALWELWFKAAVDADDDDLSWATVYKALKEMFTDI